MDLKKFSKTRIISPYFRHCAVIRTWLFLWKSEGRSKCSTSIEVCLIDNSHLPKKFYFSLKIFFLQISKSTNMANVSTARVNNQMECNFWIKWASGANLNDLISLDWPTPIRLTDQISKSWISRFLYLLLTNRGYPKFQFIIFLV